MTSDELQKFVTRHSYIDDLQNPANSFKVCLLLHLQSILFFIPAICSGAHTFLSKSGCGATGAERAAELRPG
jgi:hypothetical protein